jgi:hypothetical protein
MSAAEPAVPERLFATGRAIAVRTATAAAIPFAIPGCRLAWSGRAAPLLDLATSWGSCAIHSTRRRPVRRESPAHPLSAAHRPVSVVSELSLAVGGRVESGRAPPCDGGTTARLARSDCRSCRSRARRLQSTAMPRDRQPRVDGGELHVCAERGRTPRRVGCGRRGRPPVPAPGYWLHHR